MYGLHTRERVCSDLRLFSTYDSGNLERSCIAASLRPQLRLLLQIIFLFICMYSDTCETCSSIGISFTSLYPVFNRLLCLGLVGLAT